MENGFLGIPWLVGAFVCLAVAALYVVIWPRPQVAAARSAWSRLVLRWFHPLVWLLLAGSFFTRATSSAGGAGLAAILAVGALVCYGVFMITLIRARRSPR
jgi:hypothetical protein